MTQNSTVLLISQVYVPDPASVGQHLQDLSRELVLQGKRVVVLTPRGGYNNPSRKYAWREKREGVDIWRLPLCAFGNRPIYLRLLGGISLVLQSMFLGLFIRKLTYVLISTAPPISPLAAGFIGIFRRIKIVYWVMDLNPDQMVALGKLKDTSLLARFSELFNRMALKRANNVVALDSFMAVRLNNKMELREKLAVIPPWPYENQMVDISHEQNYFRKIHGLENRFVVMYSGNITDVHPIDTLLDAIVKLRDNDHFLFLFVGSDSARKNINAFAFKNNLKNILTLPYVPLSETQYSLSAADLHIVSMGDNMVGIVHPCKVYGIMSVGRPVLVIGSKKSHLAEILDASSIGWLVEHGDVEGVINAIEYAWSMSYEDWKLMGDRGRDLVKTIYSRKVLCQRFVELMK